jgi:hypothetical protein
MINHHQTLNNLTIKELENLIESIVKRTLNSETQTQQYGNQLESQILLNTFDTW